MAERENSWRLKGSMLVSGAVLAFAGGTYLVVEAGSGDGDHELDVSSAGLPDLTPTPTVTPPVFESPLRSLTPTATPTPGTVEIVTEIPTAEWTPGQSFTNPPFSTYRPIWTPTFAPTPAVPVVTFPPTPEPQPTPEARHRYDVADELFTRINNFRAQNGEFALIRDEDLDEAARAYAKNYYENGDYSHATHDLGGNPLERANKVSTEKQWMGIAEVINIGSNSADAVMTVWINSAPHYAAILSFPNNGDFDRRYQYLGTGCFEGPNVRQGFPNITVAVCVGSIGFPVPTPTVTEVQ